MADRPRSRPGSSEAKNDMYSLFRLPGDVSLGLSVKKISGSRSPACAKRGLSMLRHAGELAQSSEGIALEFEGQLGTMTHL